MKNLLGILILLGMASTASAAKYLDKHWTGALFGSDILEEVLKYKPNYDKTVAQSLEKTYQNIRQGLMVCSKTNHIVTSELYYEDKSAEIFFYNTRIDGAFLIAVYTLKSLNKTETEVTSWSREDYIYTEKIDLFVQDGKKVPCSDFRVKETTDRSLKI